MRKDKIIKWAVCVGFGIVLSVIVMMIINFAYSGDDVDAANSTVGKIAMVFFIIHIIWLYLILHKPIQAKMQNKTYSIIASIVIAFVLALLITCLSINAYNFKTQPYYNSAPKPNGVEPSFLFIILIAGYSVMTYATAVQIDKKRQ
jgi:Na+/melibiose symporter-like transporter